MEPIKNIINLKGYLVKQIVLILLVIFFSSGCATWYGVKKDTKDGVEWTKEKVNKGAEYVKEKTE